MGIGATLTVVSFIRNFRKPHMGFRFSIDFNIAEQSSKMKKKRAPAETETATESEDSDVDEPAEAQTEESAK